MLPDQPVFESSPFTKRLVEVNRLDAQGFCGWRWRSGMLFGDATTWWGEEAPRPQPHEGLDLCTLVDGDGASALLTAGHLIPALFSGKVVAVFADFLGQSIVVAHRKRQGKGRLHSVYAHVEAEPGVAIGRCCRAGEIIARIAPSSKPGLPAHLHLSVFWLTGALPAAMSWSLMHDSPAIQLCDPMPFISDRASPQSEAGMESKWQVYIVCCQDGTLYTGITTDLCRRLAAHNAGRNGARYTRTRRPVRLVFSEPAPSRSAAARREWQIKQMTVTQKMALIGQTSRP